jgi:hypothetical protein
MTDQKDRGANLAKGNKSVVKELRKVFDNVEKGFQNQETRRHDVSDAWDIYNCVLGPDQIYPGRNRLYAPYVYEAVEARATRFTNQLFPQSDRHIEAVSEDGTIPRAGVSLCEHYVSDTDLRQVIRALIVSGDIEGQMNLYVDWTVGNRRTASRVENAVKTPDGNEVPGEKVEDMVEEDESTGGPRVELLSDVDICVLPAPAASIEDALTSGGVVAILRRWNKRQIKAMIDKGALDKTAAQKVIDDIESYKDDSNTTRDPAKTAYHGAGIKKDGRGSYALVYEIWTELEIDDEYRLCQVFMVGQYKVLMARRNPYWCDQCPLLSAPVNRVFGSFKGQSQVNPVKKIQYFANDVLNEMADSANYTLLPITRRDPAYATSPLILAPGAIWDVPPDKVDFAELPALWQQGADILSELKGEIFQVLSVSPAMVTQGTKKKMNQAEVSQEQQIELLNTSDSTRVVKDEILNPLMSWFMNLDYQFRDKMVTIREYGDMGMKAELERVPPFEMNRKTTYFWIGDDIIRSSQQTQQKIGFMNVLRQLPPQVLSHYELDLEPILLDAVESVYGPRIARHALKDTRALISLDPNQENMLLQIGHYLPVRPMDNPQEHIPAHQASIQQQGDPFGLKTAHLVEHQHAVMMKQMQQAMPQGQPPPAPQGQGQQGQQAQQGQQGPGARPGAMPAPGRPAQNPPGAIHPDQLAASDPRVMPR